MRAMLIGLACVACVQTNAAVLNPTAQYAKTCPDAVQLYTSAAAVGRPYREVALLNSTGNTFSTTEQGMYNSQRKKAASLGANGIVLNNINEPNAGTKIIGAVLGVGAERKGAAVAIFVPEDSARTVEVCGAPEAAAPAPLAQPQVTTAPVQRMDAVPAGTNWVANRSTKTYYAVDCPQVAQIPALARLYYQREQALVQAGYKAGAC